MHEEGLLSERKVRLKDGQFVLTDSLEMSRLEDRILFLHRRFSGKPLDRDSSWWCELGASTKLRNQLTHPKSVTVLSDRDVERSLQAIIDTINAMFLAIYKRPLPVAARGLQSKMTF
ncbi:hypothetical protein RE6C_05608 [Rhodopirellula europaea 6C]|uniref:Uncharacterized protein n=1 Tax=Rhodopirellula europaea 6C TaxID=1263867 RepID=M2ALU9_9BACT|nr:hypothetical protein RE6C_05608 [Rhodopirellula europaea 6C]